MSTRVFLWEHGRTLFVSTVLARAQKAAAEFMVSVEEARVVDDIGGHVRAYERTGDWWEPCPAADGTVGWHLASRAVPVTRVSA